jgi:hypothetical protein
MSVDPHRKMTISPHVIYNVRRFLDPLASTLATPGTDKVGKSFNFHLYHCGVPCPTWIFGAWDPRERIHSQFLLNSHCVSVSPLFFTR